MGLNQQQVNVNYKEKTNDGVDSEVESGEESDHESECTQPEEVSFFFDSSIVLFSTISYHLMQIEFFRRTSKI